MTAPKWAMERAEAIIDGLAGLTGEPDELVFQGSLLHQDMAEAIAKAHREGWQAAIEAALKLCPNGDEADALRALPYQPRKTGATDEPAL